MLAVLSESIRATSYIDNTKSKSKVLHLRHRTIKIEKVVKFCCVTSLTYAVKGRVIQCFSMQVVMNKCFLQNPEKIFGADPSCCFQENTNNEHFNSEK